MGRTSIEIACGTRRGAQAEINQDVIGLNGWALHADSAGQFPPWGDRVLSVEVDGDDAAVVVVADGVGGVAESHTASLIVAEELSRPTVALSRVALVDALNLAHRRVLEVAETRPGAVGIGSTVVGLIVLGGGRLVGFNVGDSRLYFTNVDTLVQGSRDDREQFAFSTRLRLAAWVGRPETTQVEPWVNALTPVSERRVLLCSDGVYTAVDEQVLQDIVCSGQGPAEIVERLLREAGETPDDATVVVVRVTTHAKTQAMPPAETVPVPQPGPRGWLSRLRR